MPRLSGRELADRIEELWPQTKVLFMSGYTGDAVMHRETLGDGAAFIQKPFRPDELAAKVRAALGPPAPGDLT